MPIDPEAVRAFLDRPVKPLPNYKAMTEEELFERIYKATGVELECKTDPRGPYQLQGICCVIENKQTLLLFDPQIGKTWTALNWLQHYKRAGWIGKALVIAHSPVGVDVWESQTPQHSFLDAVCIRANKQTIVDEFITALTGPCDVIITTWSALMQLFTVKKLSRKKVPKLYPNRDMLREIAPMLDALVIDEIHMTKDHFSLRFEIAALLGASCEYTLGLTGTPFGRNPFPLWAQAYLLDHGKTLSSSFQFFENAFGKKTYNHFSKSKSEFKPDPAKLPLLFQKLEHLAFSYTRAEIGKLTIEPGKIELKMRGEQKATYNRLAEDMAQSIKIHYRTGAQNTSDIQNNFTRLRQVASGYLPFTDKEGRPAYAMFDDSPKLSWLQDFLENAPENMPVLIFCEFIQSGVLLTELLKKMKIPHGWLYGMTKNRAEVINDFKTNKTRVLVANTVAGGLSVSFNHVDYVCYYESPCSPIIRRQSEDRPADRPVDRALFIDDLVCAPIEEKILGFVKEGKDLLSSLLHKGQDFDFSTKRRKPK